MENIDENLGIERNGKSLSIERSGFVLNTDTVLVKMTNMKLKNYTLKIVPSNFNEPLLSAFIEDKFLKTITPVGLK